MSESHRTLPGSAYHDEAVFARERDRIFHGGWYFVGRSDPVVAGGRMVVDVAGESVLIVRDRDGALHAHRNVCRHRGARLCATSGVGSKAAITCPYHGFAYALDGRLLGTPNVGADEIDRDAHGLWTVEIGEWQGFLFVNLSDRRVPLEDWLAVAADGPPPAAELHATADLRVGFRTEQDVAANWKIVVDNYLECLHCPQVHPELVDIVPLYRTGAVVENGDTAGGVCMVTGSDSFALGGRSSLPLLPTMDEESSSRYYGFLVYPNMFLDVTGTCVISTVLHPRSADRTTVITEYCFARDTVEDPAFDPSEVVDFTELVTRQDASVCEMVQLGTGSQAFDHGVLPLKDALIVDVQERYRRLMGAD